jgi:hypothetical protein
MREVDYMNILVLTARHRVILTLCAIGVLTFGCGDGADTDGIQSTEITPDAATESDGAMLAEDSSVEVGDAQAVDTDAGLIEPDAGVQSADTSVVSNDADTEAVDGAVVTDDMTIPVQDVAVVEADMAVEATDAMAEAPDAAPMPTNQMRFAGCVLNDTWSIDITSIPPAGEGCQTGGGVALGDQTHVLRVIQGGGAGLALELLVPSTVAEYQVIEAQFIEENEQCRLIAFMENGFYFPNDQMADGFTTQIVLRFDYDVIVDENGIITGTGFSTDRYQAFPDENNLDQSTAALIRTCTEPLLLSGQINPN